MRGDDQAENRSFPQLLPETGIAYQVGIRNGSWRQGWFPLDPLPQYYGIL